MFILFLGFVAAIFLQIHLSKQKSRLLGFILPVLSFLIVGFMIFGMALFYQEGRLSVTEIVNGEAVSTVISEGGDKQVIPGAISGIIYSFLLFNIPTAILLIIYKVVRSKYNRRRDLEKMSVQDLE